MFEISVTVHITASLLPPLPNTPLSALGSRGPIAVGTYTFSVSARAFRNLLNEFGASMLLGAHVVSTC